jgi:hypothetical protein
MVAAACAGLVACAPDITGTSDTTALVETHHAILDGSVRGKVGQPVEGVEIVVDFDGKSQMPKPSTRSDGAGDYLLVLAIYNGGSSPTDSARATVYAIARDRDGNVEAITHKRVLIRFQASPNDPAHTRLSFSLPIL